VLRADVLVAMGDENVHPQVNNNDREFLTILITGNRGVFLGPLLVVHLTTGLLTT
jgi:hypothetical protein